MIGGIDIEISTEFPDEVADQIYRIIRLDWSNCIVEDSETGDRIEIFQPENQTIREMFVYRDEESKKSWDENGAVKSDANTMIHIIPHDFGVTIVVDDQNALIIKRTIKAARAFANDLKLARNMNG